MGAFTGRQWDELDTADVPLLAAVAKRVDLSALRRAAEANTSAAQPFDTLAEDVEVAMHAARRGDVIPWERHWDDMQMVFVVDGELRVRVRGPTSETVDDTTLAFVWPGAEHQLEAREDVKYASIYWTVDKPETWCQEA